MKTYEECLNEVCLKKHNHYFNMHFRRSTAEVIEIMKEAALLYGEQKWNEGAEEMRQICANEAHYHSGHSEDVYCRVEGTEIPPFKP